MLTRAQAIKQGFVIDDGQRPVAYKGPRFSPTERHEVPTELEEKLLVNNPSARKARVIITFKCNRRCVNCCNTYKSIIDAGKHIRSITELAGYDQVILTGGEPMLFPDTVIGICEQLGKQGSEVFLYTALWVPQITTILKLVKGIHYTVHSPASDCDMIGFYKFQDLIKNRIGSYRLYIDPEVNRLITINPSVWSRVEIKPWLKEGECPLPIGEELFIIDP